MNGSVLILIALMFCMSFVNCSVIRRPEIHDIRKRSTADHGITDVKARHRTVVERQLLLAKLVNAAGTSGKAAISTFDGLNTETTTNTATPKLEKAHRRHNGRGKNQKKRRNRIPRSVERSVAAMLRSEHGEKIVEAIANIIPKEDAKMMSAFRRIRKFAKGSSCSCMKG